MGAEKMASRGKSVQKKLAAKPALARKRTAKRRNSDREQTITRELRALKKELRARGNEQAATREVLKVISRSPFELQAVLQKVVNIASELCEAEFALIYRLQDDAYHLAAANNATAEFVQHAAQNPIRAGRGSLVGRTALERKVVHIPDCLADAEYTFLDYQRSGKYRSMLGIPLLRDGAPIGVIGLMRSTVRPFTQRQIDLATDFADQAGIAIENTRVVGELTESLEQQTATSEVLQVVSSSMAELGPVFDVVLANATRVCHAEFATLNLYEREEFRPVASFNVPAAYASHFAPFRPHPKTGLAQIVRTKQAVHIEDLRAGEAYLDRDPAVVAISDVAGARSIIIAPMVRENNLVGTIAIYRKEVRPFNSKQVCATQQFCATSGDRHRKCSSLKGPSRSHE